MFLENMADTYMDYIYIYYKVVHIAFEYVLNVFIGFCYVDIVETEYSKFFGPYSELVKKSLICVCVV